MVNHPIVLWHSPHTKDSIRVDWSDADPNIRLGSVNARLSMLELTAPVLQESFTALNVMPNIKWKHQWKNSFIHNSVVLEIHFFWQNLSPNIGQQRTQLMTLTP